jgi:hypothetical protein
MSYAPSPIVLLALLWLIAIRVPARAESPIQQWHFIIQRCWESRCNERVMKNAFRETEYRAAVQWERLQRGIAWQESSRAAARIK